MGVGMMMPEDDVRIYLPVYEIWYFHGVNYRVCILRIRLQFQYYIAYFLLELSVFLYRVSTRSIDTHCLYFVKHSRFV